MTTASGYMRLVLFMSDEMSQLQRTHSLSVIELVVNVYCPTFLRNNFRPRAPDGPGNILYLRDLILAYQNVQEELTDAIKPCFMRYAVPWHGSAGKTSSRISSGWGIWQLAIKEFYTKSTKQAWCLRAGSPSFWRSIDNHNRTFERFNGYLGKILEKKSIWDFKTVEERPVVDQKFRGFIVNLGRKLGVTNN